MEEELEFLLKSDGNILEAEICDVIDKDGSNVVGVSLVIGTSEEEIIKIVSELKEGELQPEWRSIEIILIEKDLKKILNLIKEFKD